MSAAPRQTPVSAAMIARVHRFRAIRHWSTREVAERMTAAGYPTSDSTIRNWNRYPAAALTADQIMALSIAFGITLDQLFGAAAFCKACGDLPPAGFICATCGATAPREGAA